MRKALGYRIWALGLLLTAAAVSAEQYVLPCRADLGIYHFDKTSLPYSTWTNTMQWLVDESRIDFSPDHAAVPEVVGVSCLEFDGDGTPLGGSRGFALFPFDKSARKHALDFNIDFVPEVIGGTKVIGGIGKDPWGAGWCFAYLDGGSLRVVLTLNTGGNGTRIKSATSGVCVAGEKYNVRLQYDGTTIIVWLNGSEVLNDSTTYSGELMFPSYVKFSVGAGFLNTAYPGFYGFNGKIISATMNGEFSASFGEYDGTVAYDHSGNENHGTILYPAWSNTEGVAPSRSLDHGYRLSGSVHIPALVDGSAAADGNPLTHPGGTVHNGAPCSLVLADGSTNTFTQLLAMPGTKTNANGAITSLYLTN